MVAGFAAIFCRRTIPSTRAILRLGASGVVSIHLLAADRRVEAGANLARRCINFDFSRHGKVVPSGAKRALGVRVNLWYPMASFWLMSLLDLLLQDIPGATKACFSRKIIMKKLSRYWSDLPGCLGIAEKSIGCTDGFLLVTLKSRWEVTQGHRKWYHSVDCVWFLLVFYSNFVRRCIVFETFDFKNAVTFKTGLGVRQCHWKCPHSIERIWLPIDVL